MFASLMASLTAHARLIITIVYTRRFASRHDASSAFTADDAGVDDGRLQGQIPAFSQAVKQPFAAAL